ncbi:DUF1853 family protein [Acinetobacter equi]|uniref:DUF1853 domain-containing protein n=1 Tax=Acinetobacter equi TaxID=1324350 RepID=A0A0N9W362_9GAMM|nr:DUF1853 family protein [Acinetobacter equi]ALH95444.1 hypothetical protein AOY20_07790 [Acinetobacter equi]
MSSLLNNIQNEYWLFYKTPVVRQLAFALLSPNIIQKIPQELEVFYPFQLHDSQKWQNFYTQYKPRLEFLDQNPNELQNFLNKLKSTRLGLRFEMLIWFWLLDSNYHPYEVLAHGLQIIQGPKTVGELDFVVKNTENNQIEHWEVALKYYLGESDLTLKNWYGLNRSDTLFKKMYHFSQKQFQFSHVLDLEINEKFAVIKGQLYLPLYQNSLEIPTWINLDRRLGNWGTCFPKHAKKHHRLSRHEWLCPHNNASSSHNKWWTDGLYFNSDSSHYYMYRSPSLPYLI